MRADDSFTVPTHAANVLDQRCNDCHEGESAEASVRFDTLPKLHQVDRLELLNKAQEQLYFGLMPPEDAQQPSDAERQLLLGWLSGELNKWGASKLAEKLQKPDQALRRPRPRNVAQDAGPDRSDHPDAGIMTSITGETPGKVLSGLPPAPDDQRLSGSLVNRGMPVNRRVNSNCTIGLGRGHQV